MAENVQTAVLRVLAKSKDAYGIGHIMAALQLSGTLARRSVLTALGKLMQKHLAERANRVSFQNQVEAEYRATQAGRDHIAAGRKVTSGNNGNWTAPPRVLPDTQRQRCWTVFRQTAVTGKATLAELVEAARRPGEDAGKMIDNARKLFVALARVRIVVLMRDRAPGFAPTSNGFHRFALVRDVGPLAPIVAKKGVFNPNAREMIPYPAKEKRDAKAKR